MQAAVPRTTPAAVLVGDGNRGIGLGTFAGRQPRQPKIENLQLAIAANKNIFGLDVTVRNSLFLSRAERAGNQCGIFDGFAWRKCPTPQAVSQSFALK
jgi:hypothetical protein